MADEAKKTKEEILDEIKEVMAGDRTLLEVHIAKDYSGYSFAKAMKDSDKHTTKTRAEMLPVKKKETKKSN